MKNYNYYDKLQKKFNNEKKYEMGLFDKPRYNGYNRNAEIKMQNAELDKPLYDYKSTYGNLQTNRDVDGAVPYKPSYGKVNVGQRLAPAVYGGAQDTIPYKSSYPKANVGAIHESPVYNSAFKKNAENQWYNKITHGSFKEDDWFKSMVKNQEKAQNWYNNTYGEKNGRKEYQNLHSRLINTPYNKIKEEEKQFANYKASDFKVPEIKPVNYSNSGSKGELSREEPKDTTWTSKLVDWIRSLGHEYQKSKLAEHEADYAAQKNIQRNVWKLGAQYFLRDYKKCYTSAWMLEHSLQDNPEDIYRGNDSRIAYLINHDNVYLSKLDEAIKNSKNGVIDEDLKNVQFDDDDDLYYSIHKANIHVKGYKQENGKWIIKATLSDTYDFTEIQTFMDDNGGWSSQAGMGTVANDVATGSQLLGAINPYKVTVEFYTTR